MPRPLAGWAGSTLPKAGPIIVRLQAKRARLQAKQAVCKRYAYTAAMLKRLLALLVFIPMFLIAWYVRNSHAKPDITITDRRYPDRATRDDRRRDTDRRDDEARNQDQGRSDESNEGRSNNHQSRRHNSQGTSGQPGAFDFYLLNLSWSPEFCATHPDKPECDAHPGFVLHGLWPQNNDGSYPEHCSDASGPSDPAAFRDLYPDAGLLSHEWSTHGTCSGLSAEAFFTQARTALHAVTIPSSLAGLTRQTAATPDDLLAQFSRANPAIPRESLALSCGNNYLTAVEVCLDHDLHAAACSNIRSCRANSVRIVPPGGSDR